MKDKIIKYLQYLMSCPITMKYMDGELENPDDEDSMLSRFEFEDIKVVPIFSGYNEAEDMIYVYYPAEIPITKTKFYWFDKQDFWPLETPIASLIKLGEHFGIANQIKNYKIESDRDLDIKVVISKHDIVVDKDKNVYTSATLNEGSKTIKLDYLKRNLGKEYKVKTKTSGIGTAYYKTAYIKDDKLYVVIDFEGGDIVYAREVLALVRLQILKDWNPIDIKLKDIVVQLSKDSKLFSLNKELWGEKGISTL